MKQEKRDLTLSEALEEFRKALIELYELTVGEIKKLMFLIWSKYKLYRRRGVIEGM